VAYRVVLTIYMKEKTMLIQSILLQAKQIVPYNTHPVWQNPFFYLFLFVTVLIFIMSIMMMKALRKRTAESKLMQQQHVAKVDNIRKEQSDTLEKIRVEMLKREEERGRQWMESEKETLHVLNGVSTLLDLSEKIGRVESEKILKVLADLQINIGQKDSNVLKKIEELTAKVEKLTSSD